MKLTLAKFPVLGNISSSRGNTHLLGGRGAEKGTGDDLMVEMIAKIA